MYFLTFDERILLFIQKTYGGQGMVRLHNKDPGKIRSITESDPLSGKTAVHLILHMVDDNHTVRGNPAFNFQKEICIQLFLRDTPDTLRFGKEAVLRADAF